MPLTMLVLNWYAKKNTACIRTQKAKRLSHLQRRATAMRFVRNSEIFAELCESRRTSQSSRQWLRCHEWKRKALAPRRLQTTSTFIRDSRHAAFLPRQSKPSRPYEAISKARMPINFNPNWSRQLIGSWSKHKTQASRQSQPACASGITQIRPMRVTSKPANEETRDID